MTVLPDDAGRDEPAVVRLRGDVALIEAFAVQGFSGTGWKLLGRELARYAIRVLTVWMITDRLGAGLAHARIGFAPTDTEKHRLQVDADLRDGVVDAAVTRALARFRRNALDGTGWKPDGGASLATYFVGACLFEVVDELKRQRRSAELYDLALFLARDDCRQPQATADDPAVVVSDREVLREHLGRLSEDDRLIVWGEAYGLSGTEIAELLGAKSSRAVERRWARLKSKEDWIRRLGGDK